MLRSCGTQTTLHSMLHTREQGTWTPDAYKELDAMVYGLQHDHAYEYSSNDDDYVEDVNTSFYSVTESELMDTDCETDDEMQCLPPERQQKFIVFEDQLNKLFKCCPKCQQPVVQLEKVVTGTMLSVSTPVYKGMWTLGSHSPL